MVCLGYWYLFLPGHITDIFLIWSNLFENLDIFWQLWSDDLYFEPACQKIPFFAWLKYPDVFIMLTSNITIVFLIKCCILWSFQLFHYQYNHNFTDFPKDCPFLQELSVQIVIVGWIVGLRPFICMWDLGLQGEYPVWEGLSKGILVHFYASFGESYRKLQMVRLTSVIRDWTRHIPSTSFEGRKSFRRFYVSLKVSSSTMWQS